MFTADPSKVRQAPDARALMKSVLLVVQGQELSTPPIAQEYFEPGINTKLTRRSKPKTDFTLPSDLPTYPLGFVPINQTPGANGEEPAEIHVKESVPADLIEVFARINAEEKVLAAEPKFGMDLGSRMAKEYTTALREARDEKKVESMMREGFTLGEAEDAMEVVRFEEAVKEAKAPVKPMSVEEALADVFGVKDPEPEPVPEQKEVAEMEVQTEPEEKPKRRAAKRVLAFLGRGRPSDRILAERKGISVEELKQARKAKKMAKE